MPNPSFENITNCYQLVGGIQSLNAPPWNAPDRSNPDLYNICSTDPVQTSSIPSNAYGYQFPHSGKGYAGAFFYNYPNERREYLQVKLDSALASNQIYCVSFYLSLSNPHYVACNNFGVFFSKSETSTTSLSSLNLIPQVIDTTIITDTLNWKLVKGEYTAQGGERYIIVGNFFPVFKQTLYIFPDILLFINPTITWTMLISIGAYVPNPFYAILFLVFIQILLQII